MKPIYLYHLTQNGVPRYVGVTENIPNRKSHHKRKRPPHTFEIRDTFTDKQEAGIAEQYHIAGYKTFTHGWNKSKGGEKLLSGENHPRWTGGFDKKAWMRAYMKEYDATPERKAYDKKRNATPERKAYRKAYMEKYQQTPEAKAKKKETNRRYYLRKKNENKNTCESGNHKE